MALDRHPWNTSFTWADHAGPFQELSATEVAHFDALGYLVVDDVIPSGLLPKAEKETDRLEAEVDEYLRGFPGERMAIGERGAITFSAHLVARSGLHRELSRLPRVLGICADLLGPDVRLYWDQAVYKKPQKPRRFPWHQDNGYAYVEPQQYLTVWIALSGATVDNGCPWVAPGLHKLGTLAHRYVPPLGYECFSEPPKAVPAEIRSGSAVVFSSLTPHLTGPNTTDDVRKAYILQFAPLGAHRLMGDADAGPPADEELCDDPVRQYEVLRAGRPVDLMSDQPAR